VKIANIGIAKTILLITAMPQPVNMQPKTQALLTFFRLNMLETQTETAIKIAAFHQDETSPPKKQLKSLP